MLKWENKKVIDEKRQKIRKIEGKNEKC